jgi:type IV pilus assembly protein PilN
MNLQINLATRVYIDTRKLNRFMLGAVILLVCWLYANLYNLAGNLSEIDRLSAVTKNPSAPVKSAQVSEKDYQQMMGRIQFVNGLLHKRAFDWLLLFNHLEAVVPEGVALTAIEPGKGGELKISGAARQFSGLRKFIENLEAAKTYADVYLVSHKDEQTPEQKSFSFSITCKAIY